MAATNKLTDPAIRNAKPKAKPYKLSDGDGMYLEVAPNGGKLWRIKYRFGGKEKRISFGKYDDVPLTTARVLRTEARTLLAQGIYPSTQRKADKAAEATKHANSFQAVATEWFAKKSPAWAPSHADRLLRRLERDIFPVIGAMPISDITPPILLGAVRKIEARGVGETAHRALRDCSQICRYAIATGRLTSDPARDLRGALSSVKAAHFPAVTEPRQAAPLIRAIYGYEGSLIVRSALRLAPLVFVRPGELRTAKWADIDLDAAEWRFLVTKTETQHVVPLSTQAVEILRTIKPVTGDGQYVFPSARGGNRPMSDNAILVALRTLGIGKDEMTGHGFRAMARTMLDEILGERPDLIEHQLAHAVRDANGRAYNRTAHLSERRRMMQRWADYLDSLRNGAEIIPFRAA